MPSAKDARWLEASGHAVVGVRAVMGMMVGQDNDDDPSTAHEEPRRSVSEGPCDRQCFLDARLPRTYRRARGGDCGSGALGPPTGMGVSDCKEAAKELYRQSVAAVTNDDASSPDLKAVLAANIRALKRIRSDV